MTFCFGIVPAITTPLAMRGDKDATQVAVLGWASLLLAYFWLSRFRLEFSSERVGYASLFRGYASIQRDAIIEAEFAVETSRYEGLWTFVVRTNAGEELKINAKVFSREALKHLCQLGSQSSNQSLEPTAGRSDA